jgi:hypothetical protein
MQSQNAGIGRTDDWDRRRAHRQARVGIIANPVKVALPPSSPREIWTRWPKLRSARRLEALRHGAPEQKQIDALGLGEDSLKGFAHELRDRAARHRQRSTAVAQDRLARAGGAGIVAAAAAVFLTLWLFA